MAMTVFVRRISKFLYIIILLFSIGHILPPPELYIHYNIAKKVALFINANENAESIYDAYSYIDWLVIASIITIIYILTMKLIKKRRSA